MAPIRFALYVLLSGATIARQLLFGHSSKGDLRPLLDGYFATAIGAERDAATHHPGIATH